MSELHSVIKKQAIITATGLAFVGGGSLIGNSNGKDAAQSYLEVASDAHDRAALPYVSHDKKQELGKLAADNINQANSLQKSNIQSGMQTGVYIWLLFLASYKLSGEQRLREQSDT